MRESHIIGIIAAFLLFVSQISLQQQTSPGEYTYNHSLLLSVVTVMWLVCVITTIICLFLNKYYQIFAILSTFLFTVLLILVKFWGHCITPYERPLSYEFLAGVGLLGIVVIYILLAFGLIPKEETA